jgi:hypothetical protein
MNYISVHFDSLQSELAKPWYAVIVVHVVQLPVYQLSDDNTRFSHCLYPNLKASDLRPTGSVVAE